MSEFGTQTIPMALKEVDGSEAVRPLVKTSSKEYVVLN